MKRRSRNKAELDSPPNEIIGDSSTEEMRADETPEGDVTAVGVDPTQRESREENEALIEGERGIPSINRRHSLQSRLNSFLALGLMLVLGVGLLGWYYHRLMTQPSLARERAVDDVRTRAQGDMPLPPLGPIEGESTSDVTFGERLLGPAPPLAGDDESEEWPLGSAGPANVEIPPTQQIDRRFAGGVFAKAADGGSAGTGGSGAHIYVSPDSPESGLSEMANSPAHPRPGNQGDGSDLASRLRPTPTPAMSARVLPTQRLLLPKGAFIDCTLETAIDSSLPGMTTCVLATDSFSADGKVVLLERGTKLVGETSGQVPQGGSRVFVVWTQARTPKGVVVPLESPGTDELGRAGLNGHVNRHFWQRFGAAILVSVIDGVVQTATNSSSEGGDAVTVNPSGSQTVMTEVLKSTINIPPTVLKHHGDRLQVLVARDLDFRSVYELRPASGG